MEYAGNTLSKEERLCGKKDISSLLAKGVYGGAPGEIKYCFRSDTGSGLNRILISVPKKIFKRAVRRNLVKRRIRESYRKQKHNLLTKDTDIMFIYRSREILSYQDIYSSVEFIISQINRNAYRQD